MISVTKINQEIIWLNPFLIEHLDPGSETIITMMNGHKYRAVETPEEIREKVVEVMRRIGILGFSAIFEERPES